MENQELTIPKEQIELMLLQANIELIQRVARLIEILEKK
jgi:hypothetical protein